MATLGFGSDISAAIARDDSGRVEATLTVTGAGDRP